MRLLLLGLMALSSSAFAEPCTSYFRGMFDGFPSDSSGPGDVFYIKGSRISARGQNGFVSYSAGQDYRSNMTQVQKAAQETFAISPNGSVIEGKFQDVFPGRPDGATDLTTLRIFRDQRVQISLDRWGGYTFALTNLQCFKGQQGSTFVLNGQFRETNSSLEQWSFLITPSWVN